MGQFLPFYSPNSPKNQNFEKMKKTPGDIIILHKCTKNHDHMLYCSWDVVHDRCNCYFSFWVIFCPLLPPPPNSPKNQNFLKMKKLPGDIIILHICTKNYDQMIYTVPEICLQIYLKKETLIQAFSCEFYEIFKDTFVYWSPLSDCFWLFTTWWSTFN